MSQYEPTILVIDDETGILDTLKILLKNSGFKVETAQGGNAGLTALNASCPDIVLTDVRMPDVGGIEILEKSQELDPELPVILMTAQASLQSAIDAVNQGGFYYIQKPFANDELRSSVLRLVPRYAPDVNMAVHQKNYRRHRCRSL